MKAWLFPLLTALLTFVPPALAQQSDPQDDIARHACLALIDKNAGGVQPRFRDIYIAPLDGKTADSGLFPDRYRQDIAERVAAAQKVDGRAIMVVVRDRPYSSATPTETSCTVLITGTSLEARLETQKKP